MEVKCYQNAVAFFELSSMAETHKILLSTVKTCELDTLPGRQFKDCIESLVLTINKITNSSIGSNSPKMEGGSC